MKLSSKRIKGFIRSQIENRNSDIAYYLKDIQDFEDPSKVLEKAQAAAIHKERKIALQVVLDWIEEMENR